MCSWPEDLLLIGALHSALFAVFHALFWRLFRWPAELSRLSAINRGVMQVLNLCLTFVFAAMALIVAVNRSEILTTRLGTHLLVFLAAFWALRLIEQFQFFKANHWASWLLSALFLAGVVLYALPLAMR